MTRTKATTVYKLTDQNMQTHRGFQWAIGQTETTSGEGDLCGPGWLYAYTSPLLAVLLNPIHAHITNPRLFKCRGVIGKTDRGLKVGCTSLTVVREIPVPKISREQCIAFGILCTKRVSNKTISNVWANRWLSGEDHMKRATKAAKPAEAAWGAWMARMAADMSPLNLIAIAEQAMKVK